MFKMFESAPLVRVSASNLPSPVGPYSPGIAFGNLLFVSGQSGREPHTGRVAEDVEAQTEQEIGRAHV